MAYVIAVCGSGGKTTLVKSLAKKYAEENKKVCITTTTHMWYDDDVKESLVVGSNADIVVMRSDIVGANFRSPRRGEHCEPDCMTLDKLIGNVISGKIYYIANMNIEKELITPLSDDDYKLVCDNFDYVIIEADGSRSMPMKIPRICDVDFVDNKSKAGEANTCFRRGEPVIPNNVNEIIIVVGMEAVGREIGVVCHRFNEFYGSDKYLNDNNIKPETIVTENLINDFVNHYYFEPLKERFSSAKVCIYKCLFGDDIGNNQLYVRVPKVRTYNDEGWQCVTPMCPIVVKRVAIVLCAAGFSRRFGSNKLMAEITDIVGATHCESAMNKKLYQLMIDKLTNAKEKVLDKFSVSEKCKDVKVDVIVISQYDEILNDSNYKDKVIMIKNDNANEGLSASIKLSVEFCKGSHSSPVRVDSVSAKPYDAIVFVNADMPLLPERELANFIYNSVLNKNGIAVMYSDDAKNPAYFEKEYFDELLKLKGDKGARELLNKYFKVLYKYYIDDKYLVDIDVKEDLELLN